METASLWAAAPAMADLVGDVLAGVPIDQSQARAKVILRQLERDGVREPGDDE